MNSSALAFVKHNPLRLVLAAFALAVCLFFASALTPSNDQGVSCNAAQAAPLKSIENVQVSGLANKAYAGKARRQSLTLKLKKKTLTEGVDYTLSYARNVNAGTAHVTITGTGDYAGKLVLSYTIKPRALTSSLVSMAAIPMQAYTGKHVKPKPSLTFRSAALKKGKDYAVSYTGNVAVGTGSVTIKGIGNFKGTLSSTFSIRRSLAKSGKLSLYRSSMPYTGKARKVAVRVTYGSNKTVLTQGVDYKVRYKNCTKVGTATVTVTGKGIYGFTLTKNYSITNEGGKIVDVSEWNGTVNWQQVALRCDLAILRSFVEYSDHSKARQDLLYDSYATSCETVGLPYGTYAYVNFKSKADAISQADQIFDAAFSNGHKPTFIALDVEDSAMFKYSAKMPSWVSAAVDELQARAQTAGMSHLKLGLYVGAYHMVSFGLSTEEGQEVVNNCFDFLWIPAYGTNNGKIQKAYEPTPAHDMWQYTSKGTVKGFTGGVDVSVIRKSGPHAHYMGWYLKR